MGKRLYVILIALLSFSFIFESFSISVDAAETKTSAMNNPDRQTINKMLTEIALEYNVPPEIVKAVAEKESGWQQFKPAGEPFISDDGGIGIMQVTNQPGYDPERLKVDIEYNIRAGVEILSKNFSRTDLPAINEKNRNVLEHWYFAIMAYNGTKPVNSPVVQSTGKPNPEAYQEKVYDIIKDFSLMNVKRLKFTREDFQYNPDSDENIKFITKQFYFEGPFTKTKYSFHQGQKAETTADVYLRESPTTDSKGTRLKTGEVVTITGPFQYEENVNKLNHFVWYPVQTETGKKGYIASSYLKYRFNDVPVGNYAENAISYLYDCGLLNGIGNDQFGFGRNLTRYEAVLLLTRANHIDLSNRPDPGFFDIDQSHPYYREIAAAVDEGYFKGLPGNIFDPNGTFTRGMMAEVLQRIYQFPELSGSFPFTDVPSGSWYADSIGRLYGAGITTGISPTKFGPENSLTREDFAVFLVRTINWKNAN
ncbi:S-layer homology domain-containing protein [Caldibacillus thermoamylovorans]|nr:S-layer homology domain-containing protein [Caldibacillus thermoamylovorans]